MATSGRLRIIELTENNYDEWYGQAYAYVRGKVGLQHIIPTDAVWPPVFAADKAAEKEAWIIKESEIASYILQTLTSSQKQHVGLDDSASVLWKKLEAVHRRKDFSNFYIEQKKLQRIKYVDGTSMQTHLNAHAELRKRMSASGFFQTDAYYCGVFLSSLPESWDNIVQMLTSNKYGKTLPLLRKAHAGCERCEDTAARGLEDNFGCVTGVDWATVSAAVLNEEGRRSERDQPVGDKGTALVAAGAAAKSHGATRIDRRSHTMGATCSYCGMKYHDATQCFKLNGYPFGHTLHNPHFVRPTTSTGHANAASSSSTDSDSGWTATIADDNGLVGTGDSVALSASSAAADGTHQWTLDTGASSHFCNDRTLFDTFFPSTTRREVTVAAGKSCAAVGTGTVAINFQQPDGALRTVVLHNVVYVPDMHGNLLSLGRLAERGTKTELTAAGCALIAPNGTVVAHTIRGADKLYRLTARAHRHTAVDIAVAAVADVAAATTVAGNSVDWHARFGHADIRAILRLFQSGMTVTANRAKAIAAIKASAAATAHCEACLRGKQPREALTGSADGATRGERPLALVHIDLCGPFRTTSRGGARYLCVIVDDYTRYVWARAISTKDAAFDAFQYYRTHAEKHHLAAGHKLQVVRSDNGGEFISGRFTAYLEQAGIRRQLTAPYTPSQNGVVERANRTIVEAVNTTFQASGLPESF